MRYIRINAMRTGYSPEQISRTMTVGKLKSFLEDFDDDLPIYLSHDNGYTYGGIPESCIDEAEYEND